MKVNSIPARASKVMKTLKEKSRWFGWDYSVNPHLSLTSSQAHQYIGI